MNDMDKNTERTVQVSHEDIQFIGAPDIDTAPILKKIKDLDFSERPYEKALAFGISSLSNSDLLAIILRSGTPGSPVTHTCREIMLTYGNMFRTLNRASFDDLKNFRGVGKVKAMQIQAVLEIVKRFNGESMDNSIKISSPEILAKLMTQLIGSDSCEHIYVACLSQSLRLLKLAEISRGLATSSVFDVKPVLKAALSVEAQAIMLCHNHPSGNMATSGPDDQITFSLRDACKAINLRFLDHVIVGGGTIDNPRYYSYHNEGRL